MKQPASAEQTDKNSRLIAMGIISTAHGIRGDVKLRSFTAVPEDITAYGPLQDKSGKQYIVKLKGGAGDALIASIAGVTTREAAEALRNTELFIPRTALPTTKQGEYYHEDLVGLTLLTHTGKKYGTITAIHNFGAGDLAAIARESGEELLPFTRAIFTQIDLKVGTCIIVPPEITADE